MRRLGQGSEAQAWAGEMPWVRHCPHAWMDRAGGACALSGGRLWGSIGLRLVVCEDGWSAGPVEAS